MHDQIEGEDLNGARLWAAEQIEGLWVGSGQNQAGLVRSPDFRAAVQFYLTYYPETEIIKAMLGNHYRMCLPRQAAMSIIDAVLKELNPEPAET